MKPSLITRLKYTLYFYFRIPMIARAHPSILRLDREEIHVLIPYRRRNKNHVNSLYLGALVVGADLAAGLLAVEVTRGGSGRITPIFKDIKGEFFRRTEDDALFICRDGALIRSMAEEALKSGERVTKPITVHVYEYSRRQDEASARFELALSVKKKA